MDDHRKLGMKLNLRDRRGSIMYGEDESDKDDSSKSSTSRKDVDVAKNANGVNGTQKTSPPSKETKIVMEPEINEEAEILHAPEPIPVPKARVVKGSRFVVLADLPAEQSGDLAITKGETLIITHTRPDGWWKARNVKGEEGLVPKTYLQHVPIDVMQEEEKKVTQMIDVKEIRQPFVVQKQDSPPLQEPAKPAMPSVTHVSVRYPGKIPKPKVKEEAKEAQVAPQDQTHDPQDVPHMKEVVMKATTPVPPRAAIVSQSMTRSYSAGQIVDPNVPVDSSLPEPHMPISIQLPEKASTKPIRCLGDALRADPHLTYACHLTPRLSHSNLAFHDLYWNYQDDKLRKRHVRVSKLIRLFRLEGMPKTDVVCGLIRAALYDRSRKTGRQIVSNVHTIRATINNGTWSFVTRTDTTISGIDYGDFLLRSNYKMEDVLLLIEVSAIVRSEIGGKQEQSLGIFKYPIVGANGECCLVNRTYAEFLSSENIFDKKLTPNHEQTQFKIVLKVLDVPKEIVPVVDAMPDVLLFNPMYVRMAYYYRRRAGTILIRDRVNPLSAEMVTDPLLACFPGVCNQPDLLDFLRDIWNARYKLVKNKSEHDQAASFFQTFLNTAYAIYRTAQMPHYDITDAKLLAERQQTISKCIEMLRQHRTAAKFLLTQPAKPLNIFDYSFDLMGPHALD